MSDLIQRLRTRERAFAGTYEGPEIFKEAADRIEQLEAVLEASRVCRLTLDEELYDMRTQLKQANAVVEAAKLTVNHADFWDRDELIPALAALGEDDV